MSQKRKRKLLDPITKDERAAKIKKFEKTFDLALKRKLSKKHKIALDAKKLKTSKAGEVQAPSTTSQARAGSTVSTAKSRGGAMVSASQIGVSTSGQSGKLQVVPSTTTTQVVTSTEALAVTTLTTTTVAITVTSFQQSQTSTSKETQQLLTTTTASTQILTSTTLGQSTAPISTKSLSVAGQSHVTTTTPSEQTDKTVATSGASVKTGPSSVTTTSTVVHIPPTSSPLKTPASTVCSTSTPTIPMSLSTPAVSNAPDASGTTTNVSKTESCDASMTISDSLVTTTATVALGKSSVTSSISPTTTCNAPSTTSTVLETPSSSTITSKMDDIATTLNTSVLPTYCTIPPVSSTLPAVIFDEQVETPPFTAVPIQHPVTSNAPSSCQHNSHETDKELSKPSRDVGTNHDVSKVNTDKLKDTCSDAPKTNIADVAKSPDLNNENTDSNTSQTNNNIKSDQSGSLSDAPALVNESSPATDNCQDTDDVMEVDKVDNISPKTKSIIEEIKSDTHKVVKDVPKEQSISSSNKEDETLSSSKDDTTSLIEANNTATDEHSTTDDKMEVVGPKELIGSEVNNSSSVNSSTTATSVTSDKIAADGRSDSTSNVSLPTTVAETPEQAILTSTSTQLNQTPSCAKPVPSTPPSASTSSLPVSQPQCTTASAGSSKVSTSQVAVTPSQVSASSTKVSVTPSSASASATQTTSTTPGSVSTVRIETTAGLGLNNLTPEKVLKFIADELMKESDAGKALLTGVAASISTAEGKVIIKPEPSASTTTGVKNEPVKPISITTSNTGQSSAPVRLILQTVPGHSVAPGGQSTSRIQVLKSGPQVVHTGVSQGKPLTPIAPAQRIVISNLPSGTVLGSQGKFLTQQGQVLNAQNLTGTKVIRMTIPRSTSGTSSTKVNTASKPIVSVSTAATTKTTVTPKVSMKSTTNVSSKPVVESFPMRHSVIKDPKLLINMNLKKWKRRCSRKSIFVIDKDEVRALARKGGLKEVSGFHYNTKWNSLNFPQDFPRPSLMTAWRYKTQSIRTLAAAAIQTRILNASMKWDEMNIKPPRGSSNTLKTSSGKVVLCHVKKC